MVNRDQWQSFLEFAATVSPDLSDYDETSACKKITGRDYLHDSDWWAMIVVGPVLFDEYVEWKREQA